MGTNRRVAGGCLALLCAAACGAVEESISTSTTLGDPQTSSSGSPGDDGDMESASVDGGTTQASASAEDASTDPDAATSDATTGITDADSGDPSTTSTTAVDPTTDDSAGATTEAVSACEPDVADTACDSCVKMWCCDLVEACSTNADCWCVASCVGDGGDLSGCGGTCSVGDTPPGLVELFGCAGVACSVECPQS